SRYCWREVLMGKPFNSSLMPTADRSAWIFCARMFICTPQIVESLAYESCPRTSVIPDSRMSDRALSRSVVGPCAGSMAPGQVASGWDCAPAQLLDSEHSG